MGLKPRRHFQGRDRPLSGRAQELARKRLWMERVYAHPIDAPAESSRAASQSRRTSLASLFIIAPPRTGTTWLYETFRELGGTLHSENAKQNAESVAKASAGARIVVNEVSVQPVGQESEAKSIASNLDDAIENNYKAVLISKGLDKEHIKFDAKNGVLTLKGNVKTTSQRKEAELLAQSVPNVQQVLNEIDVKR